MGSSSRTFFSSGICRGGRDRRRRGFGGAQRGASASAFVVWLSSLGLAGQVHRGSTLEVGDSRRELGGRGGSGCESGRWRGKPGWGMRFAESRRSFYLFDGVSTVVLF